MMPPPYTEHADIFHSVIINSHFCYFSFQMIRCAKPKLLIQDAAYLLI